MSMKNSNDTIGNRTRRVADIQEHITLILITLIYHICPNATQLKSKQPLGGGKKNLTPQK